MSIHFRLCQSYFQPLRDVMSMFFSIFGAIQYALFRWLYSSVCGSRYIPACVKYSMVVVCCLSHVEFPLV